MLRAACSAPSAFIAELERSAEFSPKMIKKYILSKFVRLFVSFAGFIFLANLSSAQVTLHEGQSQTFSFTNMPIFGPNTFGDQVGMTLSYNGAQAVSGLGSFWKVDYFDPVVFGDCQRSLQNRPVVVTSKPATLRVGW
jgi:hypothetical protein